MGRIYLTSDLHFNHDKSFIYEARGFSSIEEMNETIIKRWNEIVTPEDTVYILGDVGLGADIAANAQLLRQLNGKKFLAIGNHDTDNRIAFYHNAGLFEDIQMGYRFRHKKKSFILSHYPQLVDNGEDFTPIYSLHGHTHSQDKWSEVPHAYNVNMDAHNCTPVLLDDIYEDIQNYKSIVVDVSEQLN